jgi:lysozyme
MEIPNHAIELVKKWEGLHKKGPDGLIYPYLCPAGVWTIGYGSTRLLDGSRVRHDTSPLTPEECEELMLTELGSCVRHAVRLSPGLSVNETALGAISSFIFNLGAGNYARSTLRRRVNEERWDEAATEIKKWVWGGGRRLPGLIARRLDEADYLNGTEKEAFDSGDWIRYWEM